MNYSGNSGVKCSSLRSCAFLKNVDCVNFIDNMWND